MKSRTPYLPHVSSWQFSRNLFKTGANSQTHSVTVDISFIYFSVYDENNKGHI